jgi:hypothetical protein
MEEEFPQLFWGVKVPANGKVRLPILDDLYTELMGACLGESVLRVQVETILIGSVDEAKVRRCEVMTSSSRSCVLG